MIQRVVLIKLKPRYATPDAMDAIIEKTRDVLPRAHGVRALEISLPADSWTRRSWDLCLFIRFDSIDDVETYRTDPVHRAYADAFLGPLRTKIHVHNFELAGGISSEVSAARG